MLSRLFCIFLLKSPDIFPVKLHNQCHSNISTGSYDSMIKQLLQLPLKTLSVIHFWHEYYSNGKVIFSVHTKGVWPVIWRGVFISVFTRSVSCFCSEVDPMSVLTPDSHSFSVTHKLVFFPLRTGCQGDNGEQENPGLRGPFPFQTHFPRRAGCSSRHHRR